MMAENGVVVSDKCMVKFRYSSGINITSNQKLLPGKIGAAMEYYKWLCSFIRNRIFGSDAYTDYLYRNTVGYLSVYGKLLIIHQISTASIVNKIRCLYKVVRGDAFTFRDKLSVVWRSL